PLLRLSPPPPPPRAPLFPYTTLFRSRLPAGRPGGHRHRCVHPQPAGDHRRRAAGVLPAALGAGAVADLSDAPNCGSEFIRELLRSEEHTSELQSRENLVCRLLLEKKK